MNNSYTYMKLHAQQLYTYTEMILCISVVGLYDLAARLHLKENNRNKKLKAIFSKMAFIIIISRNVTNFNQRLQM